MSNCGSCGKPATPGDRFCGHCGATVTQSTTPSAPTARPAAAPPPSGGNKLGLALLLAGLVVLGGSVGVYLHLTSDTAEDSDDGDRRHVSKEDKDDKDDKDEKPSKGGDNEDDKPTPSRADVEPKGEFKSLPSGATEVDRPGSFDYVKSPPSCAHESLMTDDLKKVALGVDEQLRKGSTLSWEEEKKIGDQMIDLIPSQMGGRLNKGGVLTGYIASVGEQLVSNVARKEVKYHFYVLEDTEVVNAFALPGGYVVVTEPLLKKMAHNEAQLAAVLGHEIGHADMRHPVAVFEATRALGIPDDEAIAQALVQLGRTPYSAAQEENADEYGAKSMHLVGYSVFQAVSMFEAMAKDEPESPAKAGASSDDPLGGLIQRGLAEAQNVLQSHPNSSRRACLLKHVASDLYDTSPREEAYVGTSNLDRKTPMSERVF